MKTITKFLVVVLLQTALLVAMIVRKQSTLNNGKVILLETEPLDPRDLFRGDYVILNYVISRIQASQIPSDFEARENEYAFVRLAKKGIYWQVASIHQDMPDLKGDDVAIRGRIDYIKPLAYEKRQRGHAFRRAEIERLRMHYGIENYFIPEGTGLELERPKPGQKVNIRIAVDDDGDAGIKAVLLNDKVRYEETLF